MQKLEIYIKRKRYTAVDVYMHMFNHLRFDGLLFPFFAVFAQEGAIGGCIFNS